MPTFHESILVMPIASRFFLLVFISATFISCSRKTDFSELTRVIEQAIADSVFPGASILVGRSDSVLFKKQFGRFTYAADSRVINSTSLFDLASVTKALATTFCIMKLYDEGKLDLEQPVAFYLPEFAANGKEAIQIKDLLLHESGLKAYHSPDSNDTRSTLLDTITTQFCSYEPNSKTVYSCLNFISLMLVVESISGMSMPEFYATHFTEPLGLRNTVFSPHDSIHYRCVPTSPKLQGMVHDPLARSLNGFSGNAGLFSTADDLSVLVQLLLNHGKFKGKIYFSPETVALFTKRYHTNSTRALGFDTRSDDGKSSSGKYFSQGTYGHLDYTGTSIWIDPAKDVYVIFLTNRVYPDDSSSIREVRPAVHDAAMIALFQ
jgi:CubicO group peptidase (beta-lactamase class C family)